MIYETLSDARKLTILEIAKAGNIRKSTITRKELNEICVKNGISFPQWLTVPENTISRGLYGFPNLPELIDETEEIQTITEPTDDEIFDKITDIDETFKELVNAVANGSINSLIISGAPGLGKSYDVNKILTEKNGGEWGHVFWRGYIKATGLFKLLYENRQKGQILVLDDTDAVFDDEVALGILKHALEIKSSRIIGWGSEKGFISEDGEIIPRYFEYQGSVIFLSNLSIRKMIEKDGKNAKHHAALESRSLIFDIKIETPREFLMKIKLKMMDGLLDEHGLSASQQDEVFQFLEDHHKRLTELSLRMAEKIGILYKSNPTKWKKLAKHICLR